MLAVDFSHISYVESVFLPRFADIGIDGLDTRPQSILYEVFGIFITIAELVDGFNQ